MKSTTIRLTPDQYEKLVQYQVSMVQNGKKPRLAMVTRDIIRDLKPEQYTEPAIQIPEGEAYVRVFVNADDETTMNKWRHAGIDTGVPYTFLLRNAIVSSLESS